MYILLQSLKKPSNAVNFNDNCNYKRQKQALLIRALLRPNKVDVRLISPHLVVKNVWL